MKKTVLVFLVLHCITLAFSQNRPDYRNASYFITDEPLAGVTDLRSSAEIYTIWQDSDNTFQRGGIDYFAVGQPDLALKSGKLETFQAENGTFQTALQTIGLDIDQDGLDEIARISNIKNRGYIIEIDDGFEEGIQNTWNSKESTGIANPDIKPILLMGEIDQIPGEDLALVFQAFPESGDRPLLKIQIIGLNESKDELIEKGVFEVELSVDDPQFSATISDLDLDGNQEVSILYKSDQQDSSTFSIAAIGFTNGVSEALVEKTYRTSNTYTASISYGDFDGDIAGELAIFHRRDTLIPDRGEYRVLSGFSLWQAVDGPGGDENVFEELRLAITFESNFGFASSFEKYTAMQVMSGNLDFDNRDELVLIYHSDLFDPSLLLIYHFDDTLGREDESALYFLNKESIFCNTSGAYGSSQARISDMDRDGRDEIVYVYYGGCTDQVGVLSSAGTMYYDVYNQENGSFILSGSNQGGLVKSDGQGNVNHSFALGDFDGDNIRAGQGKYFKRTGIQHPLIILNAPPVHFDLLGEEPFDVNKCYNGNFCDFSSTYFKSSTTTVSTETQVQSDWSISATVSGSVSGAAASAEASVTGRYGEGFSNYKGSSKTIQISTEVSAVEDDQIYATVVDYDIWEYPLYVADTVIGHLISIRPVLTENRWFPSKSYSAFDYIPDHEVGNILSYREYTSDRSPIGQAIRQNFVSDAFTLNQNFNAGWTINTQTFEDNGASKSRNIGVAASASVSGGKMFAGFGAEVEVSVEGEYNASDLVTHQTAVSEELEISVNLGGVDESLGEVKYIVSPYCYWSSGGALVVDYAVRPELPAPGAPDTWWSANYGQQVDPALILPWKYDPEKGFSLQEENIKRQQSKSISFSNGKPSVGEEIEIIADIHNWSLLPISQTVKVAFYLCDPYDESNRLISTNGNDAVFSDPMDPRGRSLVKFKWKVPEDIPNFPRIYARIDPDNELSEIHESNNVGFNILNISTNQANCPAPNLPTSVSAHQMMPERLKIFPNPARNSIQLITDQQVEGTLTIFDLWGREVYQVEKNFPNSVSIENLNTGTFIYRLETHDLLYTDRFMKH